MKKRILSILLVCAVLMGLTACGESEKAGTSKEYDVEEFGKLLKETDDLFETKSEYLTSDELQNEEAYKLYEECSKETGLPFNKKVTIRGKKQSSMFGFRIVSSDEKYKVPCFFDLGEPSNKNISVFIDDGEAVLVTGVISEKEDSYGCLTNVVIESPETIDETYKSNIGEVLDGCNEITGCKVVIGEVELIQTLNEFENTVETLGGADYEHNDYYFDSVATISGSDEGTISFVYNSEFYDFKKGDKVATQGYVDDLMHLRKADGSIKVFWGFMENVYDIYTFK